MAGGVNFQKINPSQDTLPFPDNNFNMVYSIAVFHHLPKEHAQKMAQELYRVTQSGGVAVITVWNLYQKKYLKNLMRNWIQKISGQSR